MARVRSSSRAVTRVMLCASALTIPSVAMAHAPAASPGATAATPEAKPPVQTPKGLAPTTDVAPPPAEPGTPPASGDALVPAPDAGATPPAEPVPADPPAGDPAGDPAPGGISADMLDEAPPTTAAPTTAAPTKPAAPVTAASDDEELTPNEAITQAYAPKFRPRTNPGRLNIAARLMFANAGGGDSAGGRLGGLSADVGQSWNHFGYALTGTVWGGRYVAAPEGTTELNALLGIGPTVGLGRMALLGRGFLDLRAGYDFYYGVVNRRGEGTALKPQGADGVSLARAQNLAPHGPRVRLDLGLVALNDARRYFHGVGVSMGYQALVGSLVGKMPVAHMLTIGIAYWMG